MFVSLDRQHLRAEIESKNTALVPHLADDGSRRGCGSAGHDVRLASGVEFRLHLAVGELRLLGSQSHLWPGTHRRSDPPDRRLDVQVVHPGKFPHVRRW